MAPAGPITPAGTVRAAPNAAGPASPAMAVHRMSPTSHAASTPSAVACRARRLAPSVGARRLPKSIDRRDPHTDRLDRAAEVAVFANHFAGSIPLLSGLTQRIIIDVDTNQLTGSIALLTGVFDMNNFDVGSNPLTGRCRAWPDSARSIIFASAAIICAVACPPAQPRWPAVDRACSPRFPRVELCRQQRLG